jgi:hypothetical protein
MSALQHVGENWLRGTVKPAHERSIEDNPSPLDVGARGMVARHVGVRGAREVLDVTRSVAAQRLRDQALDRVYLVSEKKLMLSGFT